MGLGLNHDVTSSDRLVLPSSWSRCEKTSRRRGERAMEVNEDNEGGRCQGGRGRGQGKWQGQDGGGCSHRERTMTTTTGWGGGRTTDADVLSGDEK